MTRTINNRRRNQKNRNKLAALAKKAKKERHLLGWLQPEQALIEPDGDLPVIAAALGDRGISRNVSHAVEVSKIPWLVHPTPSGQESLGIFALKQARERQALTLVATAREAVVDRLDWQLARLRRELQTAARFADEGAAIIAELTGMTGGAESP